MIGEIVYLIIYFGDPIKQSILVDQTYSMKNCRFMEQQIKLAIPNDNYNYVIECSYILPSDKHNHR